MTRPSPGTVLGGLALVVALGGVAIASIPNANGVYTGCYAKGNGALRIIDGDFDDCTTDEVRILWNQQGVQGPTGPKGPAGRDGTNGVDGAPGAGSGPAFFTDRAGRRTNLRTGGTGSELLSLRLPRGSYFVVASIGLAPQHEVGGSVQCFLIGNGGRIAGSNLFVSVPDNAQAFGRIRINVAQSVTYNCALSPESRRGAAVIASRGDLQAIPVGSIRNQ